MKINLEDRLVQELDSIFDNERTSQAEWDVCIEDIVEEYIARVRAEQTVTTVDELEDIYKGITHPPFNAKVLRNRFNDR